MTIFYQYRWTSPNGESGLSTGYRSLVEAEAAVSSERRAGRKASVICWRCGETENWCPADWRTAGLAQGRHVVNHIT